MIKKVAIFLSLLFFFSGTRDLTTYVFFYLNQDYISNNLCVNKDVPLVMCNGSCYIADSITENHEDNSEKAPNTQQKETPIQFCLSIVSVLSFQRPVVVEKALIACQSEVYAFDYHKRIFHPPNV